MNTGFFMSTIGMDLYLKRLGVRLRYLRNKKGDTMAIHKKISKIYKIRMNQSYYSKLERGMVSPPIRTILALANYFEVDLNYLLDIPISPKYKNLELLFQEPEFLDVLENFCQEMGIKKAKSYLLSTLKANLNLLSTKVQNPSFQAASSSKENAKGIIPKK